MKANNFLKVMLGTGAIVQKAANNVMDRGSKLVEETIVKGNYVTREEFEVLQAMVIKLQNELVELKKSKISESNQS
ncbi:hypothetical protein [Candidatus Tisiphia endosymbiont of Nemotelus uliginosus]|uniref:hypothetical protein n=1 Tax=Candidatus Tisiphia endosymbiont of Nemotelus uliginosus TaxID=3077926 RepID=UPI0035C89DD0